MGMQCVPLKNRRIGYRAIDDVPDNHAYAHYSGRFPGRPMHVLDILLMCDVRRWPYAAF
jgi:hypothetical protein